MAVESFGGPGPVDLAASRANRRSQAVYETLQKEIVLGQLAPNRALTELDLADRFACSQSTVREALMQLNEQGLVRRLPNRGTFVAPCNSDDARALLSLRKGVECGYLDRVVRNATPALQAALGDYMNAMRNAARDGDEYLLSVHDRAFHSLLFSAANLPLVEPILARCLIHNHRYKILNSAPNRSLDETAERHVPILEALKAGDVERLRELLGVHISTIVDFGPDLADEGTP